MDKYNIDYLNIIKDRIKKMDYETVEETKLYITSFIDGLILAREVTNKAKPYRTNLQVVSVGEIHE